MTKIFYFISVWIFTCSCAGLQKAPDRPSSRRSSARISFSSDTDQYQSSKQESSLPTEDTYVSTDTEIPIPAPENSSKEVSESIREEIDINYKLNYSRQSTIDQARSYLGIPYEYGGCDRDGVDCSGLIQQVFALHGHILPRNSRDQARYGSKIKRQQAQPGDLVFFAHKGRIHHLGLITHIDSEQLWVIHSTSSKGVIEQDVMTSSYWKKRIHSFRSVF